ncbi:MAG: hypothetical protein DLM69_02115 [Candidatus Chloroheliales bacterium]|nr:MAG: hypothetical protein DLM69_02115 [Chloroflexota bacterium]
MATITTEQSKGNGATLTVEQHGVEPIPFSERHGKVGQLFTLWFSANLGMPAWLVGALAIVFGLSLGDALLAIVVGNLIGCALVGVASMMGPLTGVPQLPLTRRSFGRLGAYLPAFLNWLSCTGWYAVNSVLGSLALARLFGFDFLPALLVLSAVQILLGIYGHNLIHAFERVMAVVLGALFVVMYVTAAPAFANFSKPAITTGDAHFGMMLLLITAVASYVFSWSTYGADYSRYLRPDSSKAKVFGYTFLGSFLSCVLVEFLGALVTSATGFSGANADPIQRVVTTVGSNLAIPALIAIILGTITANVLNIYTGAMSLLTMQLPVKRWMSVVAVGLLGGVFTYYLFANNLSSGYERFLLLISYWIAPWLAVVAAHFFIVNRGKDTGQAAAVAPFHWSGIAAFLVGVAASVPFISSQLFSGPFAGWFSGGDVAYYIGFLVAGGFYLALARLMPATTNKPMPTPVAE